MQVEITENQRRYLVDILRCNKIINQRLLNGHYPNHSADQIWQLNLRLNEQLFLLLDIDGQDTNKPGEIKRAN